MNANDDRDNLITIINMYQDGLVPDEMTLESLFKAAGVSQCKCRKALTTSRESTGVCSRCERK